MGINSSWEKKFPGISGDVRKYPYRCTMWGAYFLSDGINRLGYNWNAVGCYNARSQSERKAYAHAIKKCVRGK